MDQEISICGFDSWPSIEFGILYACTSIDEADYLCDLNLPEALFPHLEKW